MVFQNYALYPHMTVFDNLAFALKVQGLKKAEIAERVGEVAGIVELEDYLLRRPAQLSCQKTSTSCSAGQSMRDLSPSTRNV